MKKNDPISKIMSNDIASVQVNQALSAAYHLMADKGIHHVPVVDGKKLVGLISFTDMMKLNLILEGATEHTIDAILDQQYSVKDVMTSDLSTLNDRNNVRQAAEALAGGGFHSLPVTDSEGNLAGIVTSTDLIRYLNDQY